MAKFSRCQFFEKWDSDGPAFLVLGSKDDFLELAFEVEHLPISGLDEISFVNAPNNPGTRRARLALIYEVAGSSQHLERKKDEIIVTCKIDANACAIISEQLMNLANFSGGAHQYLDIASTQEVDIIWSKDEYPKDICG